MKSNPIFQSHKMSDETLEKSETMRNRFEDMYNNIMFFCPDSRERSLALTKLEESSFWVNACLSRHQL